MTTSDRDLIIRYGTSEPPAAGRSFECGRFSFVLEHGAVRWLKWDDREILRGIAFLLRDRDWGTPPAKLDPISVDAESGRLSIHLRGRIACDGECFEFTSTILVGADGTFSFTTEGQSGGPLLTNRCGLVILHPADFAGLNLEIGHCDGSREVTQFPRMISPGQPAFNIRSLGYTPRGGPHVLCRIDASLPSHQRAPCEMEDQRNWSDASFKTYVGSLLDPWPYLLQPDFQIRQHIEIVLEEIPAPFIRPAVDAKLGFGAGEAERMPPIGIGFGVEQPPCDEAAVEALEALSPQALVLIGRLDAAEFEARSTEIARLAARCGAAIQLQLIVPPTRDPWRDLQFAAAILHRAGASPKSVMVCPDALLKSYQPDGGWPDLPPLEDYYSAAKAAFPGSEIGGGMVTFFTELNRKRPTGAGIDYITHTTSPNIHAADDDSVMETLQSLPAMAETIAALWPGLRYRVGPASIALRSNPYGTNCVANRDRSRLPLSDRDPRQSGLFAAAWSTGYAAALAGFGLDGLSLHDLAGPLGVLPTEQDRALWTGFVPQPRVRPVFHVMRTLAAAASSAALPHASAPAGTAAVGWKTKDNIHHALVANLRSGATEIELGAQSDVLVLDSGSFAAALADVNWASGRGATLGKFELEPYAVAFVRW
jgi:hypothetical protein